MDNKTSHNNKISRYPSPFWQKLSYTKIWNIVVVYSLVVIFFIYKALQHISLSAIVLPFLFGICLSTLLEYFTHRFIFHGPLVNQKVQFFMHGYHHIRPTDPDGLLVPLFVTIPLAFIFYFLYRLLFADYADAIFAGFMLGYINYDLTHYLIHQARPKTPIGKFLKQYHFFHHFKSSEVCFGVTSPVWDHVFNTKKREQS